MTVAVVSAMTVVVVCGVRGVFNDCGLTLRFERCEKKSNDCCDDQENTGNESFIHGV